MINQFAVFKKERRVRLEGWPKPSPLPDIKIWMLPQTALVACVFHIKIENGGSKETWFGSI